MRDIIPIIAKQLHEWFPDKKIAATRFMSNYEYGQFYIGEEDRNIDKELTDHHFAKRDIIVIYSQNPVPEQKEVMEEFDKITSKIEDFCCHTTPMWHSPYFDVFQSTLIISFQIWERYVIKDDSIPILSGADFSTSFT